MAENVNSKNATIADEAALGGAAAAGAPAVDAPASGAPSSASASGVDASPRGFAPSAGAPAPTPRTREEIAESLRVRTRRGTPTEKLEVIMTSAGLDRVEAATVMVIGLGGVGSNCVEALARGGVGHLIVLDHDIVGLSNINRQAIAFHSTLGRKKHEVVRDMVHDINPNCQVEALDMFLRADDVAPLLDRYLGKVDMLIDAIDSVSAKLAIAEYADRTGMPLISSMGGANKLHPECLRFADVSETSNDPLARVMRKECRKRGISRLRVLYSCEEPVKRPAVEGAERRERTNLGTASFMPPIFGQMLAGKVLCEIAQVPEA